LIQGKLGVHRLTNTPVEAKTAWVGAEVFKSGRTTGVTPSGARMINDRITGTYNPCTIISTSATVRVEYCPEFKNTVQGQAVYEDVIMYRSSGEWFADRGDSGAALLAKDPGDNNKTKLVGIHFASTHEDANSDGVADQPIVNIGIGCHIKYVNLDLNLTNWEGTVILPTDAPCAKVAGTCYTKVDETMERPHTHGFVDEEFTDCSKCVND
jgi:hypothetical protein